MLPALYVFSCSHEVSVHPETRTYALLSWLGLDWGSWLPQTAKMHLEKAIEVAHREGCAVTEIEIAEHHYKLVCPVGH